MYGRQFKQPHDIIDSIDKCLPCNGPSTTNQNNLLLNKTVVCWGVFLHARRVHIHGRHLLGSRFKDELFN